MRAAVIMIGLVISAIHGVDSICTSNQDCSLNGVCNIGSGACACDTPWTGVECGTLSFAATTPASGKSIYAAAAPLNSWNGPIVTDEAGKLHIYVPLFKNGSLSKPTTIKHGLADVITGPWDFTTLPDITVAVGVNPAAVVFTEPTTGKKVYSLWVDGVVLTAASAYGPFISTGFRLVGGNPAPVFHNGAFYMVNQATQVVYTTPVITNPKGRWTVYANISHAAIVDPNYHVEDPFLWIDKRGNWHIINHAYNNSEFDACAKSSLSSHFYSVDGKSWSFAKQPYSHAVNYDDGTSHTYATLERPNIHFDATGQMTHINLAADMITGNEGCQNRSHSGHTPCDDW